MKTIIVDDERLARNLIREYLAEYPRVNVVAECENGEEAVNAINDQKPELVFLDIQMPGLNGFDVLERVNEIPRIIFSTAYERYALKAFEVNAIDYLLKPYDRERFAQAISRVLNSQSGDDMSNKVAALMQELQKRKTYADRLFVKLRGRVVPVEIAEIEWIEAQGDYAEIHSAKRSYLSSQSMTKMEALLDPNIFVRIHRSSIVNANHIVELVKSDSGHYRVRTRSGRELPVGPTKVARLKRWMV